MWLVLGRVGGECFVTTGAWRQGEQDGAFWYPPIDRVPKLSSSSRSANEQMLSHNNERCLIELKEHRDSSAVQFPLRSQVRPRKHQ